MKTILSIVTGFILLSIVFNAYSDSKISGNAITADIFKSRIIGKWYYDNKSSYITCIFDKGGLYKAWVYQNAKKEKLLYTMKGEWQYENKILTITVPNSQISPPPFGINFGVTVEIKEIQEVGDNVIFFSDQDGYQKFYIRIKD